MNSRADLELALARALSRHIGYTSGAYDLTRIFSILEFFLERPSGYRQEIVRFLADTTSKTAGLTVAYLEEVINFAQAMGLVETVSTREARLQRISATELGRSLLGAKNSGNPSFYAYYQCKAVLRADADSLLPVLLYFQHEQTSTLQDFFLSFQRELRTSRWNWLKKVFPQGQLLDRVVAHISWLRPPTSKDPQYRIDFPTKNTARHHTAPRQGWLQELNMLDRSSKVLTAFGRDVLTSLQPNDTYFWLGPPHDVQSLLRIEDTVRLEGPFEDQLNFGRHQIKPSAEELDELIEDVFQIMLASFESAKLVHAMQASLQLPVEYINFRAYRDQRAFTWETVLDDLFKVKRGQVDRYSAHTGKIGFYRPTAKS